MRELVVDFQVPLRRRGDGDADEPEIEVSPESFLAFYQRQFGLLPLGDIRGDAGNADESAVRITHLESAIVNPAHRAVRPGDAVFDCGRCRVGENRCEAGHYALAFLGQDRLDPLMRICVEAFGRPSPDEFVTRADVKHLREIVRTNPENVRDVIGELAEFFLAVRAARPRSRVVQ